MATIPLSDLETLTVGLFALVVASAIARRVRVIGRLNIPIPVVGGVLVAIVASLLHAFGGISLQFAGALRSTAVLPVRSSQLTGTSFVSDAPGK